MYVLRSKRKRAMKKQIETDTMRCDATNIILNCKHIIDILHWRDDGDTT